MIYHAYELVRRGTRPVAGLLGAYQLLAWHERNPLRQARLHRAAAALLEMPFMALKPYPKPEYGVPAESAAGGAVLEERCRRDLPFASLVEFGVDDAPARPKVLIAAALSGHFATLLRDTVRGFARDFAPFITDWKDAKTVPLAAGDFGLDDYVAYLIEFLEALGPRTHLVATCQSAPAAMVAAAVLARRKPELVPPSITLMAGPVDTRVNPNPLLQAVIERVPLPLFTRLAITTVPSNYPGAGRRVYPGWKQLSAFMLLNLRAHAGRYRRFLSDVTAGNDAAAQIFRAFYDEYYSVLDATESFYVETLQRVFFEHHIPTGRMTFRGEPVDFAALTDTSLLTIEAANDELCPPGQTQAAQDLLPGIPADRRRHHLQAGVGHYGVFSGSRFQNEIYPVARDFILQAENRLGA